MKVSAWTRARRFASSTGQRGFFVIGDIVLFIAALLTAAWLRFDGRIPATVVAQLPLVAVLAIGIKLGVFAWQGLYAMSWSHVGLLEMARVFRAVTVASVALVAIIFGLKSMDILTGFPRAVLLLDYALTLHAIGAFRMGRRIYRYLFRRAPADGRVALIVGAGAAGEQLARSLWNTPAAGYTVEGFIDDDPAKRGTMIHGVRVLGNRDELPAFVRSHRIEAVLIAIPSASSQVIRHVVSLARDAGVREIRTVPPLDRIINGRISFTDLQELRLTDLLGRQVVKIDTRAVGTWLEDQTVLVTGAGGSIGSELCRQIANFHPRDLVLLDMDETSLFWLEQEMQRVKQHTRTVLADVRNAGIVQDVCRQVRPRVVFHAAAYKHVGLMERHPAEAVSVNIAGTRIIAQASIDAGVEKFLLISTDKAVNPSSVMGATKRVAEQICLALNGQAVTRFLAVRFGNVLGSRGSVIPLFQDQIRRGEPLTVRGPEMRRYFMAISEAVLLVLQAGVMSKGGEIFVLDMGDPIRIVDLARELIRLSGLEPDKDVPIVFADPEPGEKESEDFLTAEEGTVATRHDRIFAARGVIIDSDFLLHHVGLMEEYAKNQELGEIVQSLRELVPTYHPSELLLSQVASPLRLS